MGRQFCRKGLACCPRAAAAIRNQGMYLAVGFGMRSATLHVLRWTGTETCPHCLQSYVLELERRCGSCDAQGCPFCVTSVSFGAGLLCGSEECTQRSERPKRSVRS